VTGDMLAWIRYEILERGRGTWDEMGLGLEWIALY
jgi:hypothetical protein